MNFGAETKLFGVADNQSEREGDPFVKAVDTRWLHTSFTVPLSAQQAGPGVGPAERPWG